MHLKDYPKQIPQTLSHVQWRYNHNHSSGQLVRSCPGFAYQIIICDTIIQWTIETRIKWTIETHEFISFVCIQEDVIQV